MLQALCEHCLYVSFNPFKVKWLLYVPAPLAARGLAFCIYGFCMFLTVNSDYFLKQRYPVDLCNGEV
jgi:hypothetical protein